MPIRKESDPVSRKKTDYNGVEAQKQLELVEKMSHIPVRICVIVQCVH